MYMYTCMYMHAQCRTQEGKGSNLHKEARLLADLGVCTCLYSVDVHVNMYCTCTCTCTCMYILHACLCTVYITLTSLSASEATFTSCLSYSRLCARCWSSAMLSPGNCFFFILACTSDSFAASSNPAFFLPLLPAVINVHVRSRNDIAEEE